MSRRRAPLILLSVAAALTVTSSVLAFHTSAAHPGVPIYDFFVEGTVGTMAIISLAAVLSFRMPKHHVTLAFVLVALMGSLQQMFGSYAVEALLGGHGARELGRLALALSGVTQSWFVFAFLLLVILFPTGRPLAGPWIYVIWAFAPLPLVSAVDIITRPQELGSHDFPPLLGTGTPLIVEVATWVFGVTVVGGTLIQVIVRFVRSRGVERQQLKWFAFTFVVGFFVLLAPWTEHDLVGTALWTAVPLAVLTSIALAILRYRLYEIDRIVSRTVTYTLVVILLGVLVLALISALALFLPSDDPLVVAVATLAVFALFNPVRLRVQRVVDRRFNRTRYDSERVIDEFAGSLRDTVDPEGLVDGWLGVVQRTMQPGSAGVWVR